MSEYNRKIASAQRTMRSAMNVALALLLGLISLAPAAMAAGPVTIVIGDTLDPKQVTVTPGTTVTWRNDHDERHRMRSQSGPVEFDSGNLDPGQAFSTSFNVEGTYRYLDERNDENTDYHGTIIVSSEAGQPTEPPGDGDGIITVDVVDRLYRPTSVTIDPGTTVTWGNIDDRPHTVTARDGSFDSGIFDTGGSYTRTFDTPGTFEYFCILHPDMVGTITVTGSDGSPPPPPPPEPDPDPDPPPAPAEGDVTIFDNGYTPASLSVPPGFTVTWANTGAVPHTVTDRAGNFDSGLLMSGDTYSRQFDTAGTFNYICTLHPEMTATLIVTDGDGTAPPPEDPLDVDGPDSPTVDGPSDVEIVDNGYLPASMEVGVGSTLTWVNTGELPHTVTDRLGNFDSGLLMSGDSYRRTFQDAGTFDYYCTIHPEMVAVVTVIEGVAPVGASDGTLNPAQAQPETDRATNTSTEAAATDEMVVVGVDVIDLDYDPRDLTVDEGTTVVWSNVGDLPHTVTASGLFDSGIMVTGDSFSWTFAEPGIYEYLCTLHPGMSGTVIVRAGMEGANVDDVVTAGMSSAGGSVEADPGASNLSTIALSIALGLAAIIGLGALARAVMMLKQDLSAP